MTKDQLCEHDFACIGCGASLDDLQQPIGWMTEGGEQFVEHRLKLERPEDFVRFTIPVPRAPVAANEEPPELPPSKEPVSHGPCASCGMIVASNEYHPFAACLMHEACRNAETVRANLEAVIDHGYRASRASHEPPADARLIRALVEITTGAFMARQVSHDTVQSILQKHGISGQLMEADGTLRTALPPGTVADAQNAIEQTGLARYDVVPGDYEAGFRFSEQGEWVRFDDVWPELQQLRARATQPPPESLCPNCEKDEVGTFTADDWFLYGVEKQFRLVAKDVLFFRCMACDLEFTGEDGEQKRLQAVRDHLERTSLTKEGGQ